METSEWGWFRASLADALIRPRRFATRVALEHYGLAGVLIGLLAGIALSATVDVAVILSKAADPLAFINRLAVDAVLLGVRLDIVLSLVALLAVGAARVARRDISIDQTFTALSFATVPLFFAPAVVVLMVAAAATTSNVRDALLVAAALLGAALVARVLIAVVMNIAGLVRGATPLVAGVALLAAAFVLQDQISRVTFTVLSYAPGLLAPPAATAIDGEPVEVIDLSLRVPATWTKRSSGAAGIVAQYELPDVRMLVMTAAVSPVSTPGEFASSQAGREQRDFASIERTEQRFVRIDSAVGIEQLWHGRIGKTAATERPVTERLYTFVVGARGYVVEFFLYSPQDEAAALEEVARIAASIRIMPRR